MHDGFVSCAHPLNRFSDESPDMSHVRNDSPSVGGPMAAEDRRSFRWGGSFAPRTGWAAGPIRSRWTLDRGGAARNRVSPWRFPEPLPSPPSIKCTGLREPTGGNFRRERRQHTKPSPAEAVDS